MVIEWGDGNWIAHYDIGGIIFSFGNGEDCEYLYLISQYSGYPYTYRKISEFLTSNETIIKLGHCEIQCDTRKYKQELKTLIEGWLEYLECYIDSFKEFCRGNIDNVEMYERTSVFNVSVWI